MWELAATPPATATLRRPQRRAASMTLGTSISLTAAEKEAARDGRSSASSFCRALWMRLMAAVFRPEKDMSSGASWTCTLGKAYLPASPVRERRSMGAPPG